MNPSPSLPQHDPANAEDRRQLLYAARQQYQYDHIDYTADYYCFAARVATPRLRRISVLIHLYR